MPDKATHFAVNGNGHQTNHLMFGYGMHSSPKLTRYNEKSAWGVHGMLIMQLFASHREVLGPYSINTVSLCPSLSFIMGGSAKTSPKFIQMVSFSSIFLINVGSKASFGN